MNKTTITFWRGLRTIGGNIAEIRYGKDRVIFDFGLLFDPAGALLGDSIGREKNYVHDLLRLGMIPSIDGVYSKANLKDERFYNKPQQSFEDSDWNTGVFISHLHLDHMGALRAISPDLPIYMSQESIDLYRSLIQIGEEEVNDRDFTTMKHDTPIQIGAIKVTPFRVDHDVAGAMSILIETPDLNVVYSGDLRMHGQYPDLNEAWIKQMEETNVDVLLMEGTSFRPIEEQASYTPICESEKEVANVAGELIRSLEGLALFNIYHRNIDRISHMLHAAKLAGRKAVLEPETAFIADKFLDDATFLIIKTNKSPMKEEWQKILLENHEEITFEEINNSPNNFLLQNSFNNLMYLLDYELENSIYLHSNGAPLGDFDPNYQKLLSFLDRLGVTHQSLDVSGHASQEDILTIVDRIKPEILVPWHSHFPELMKPINPEQMVFLPEDETTYIYENKALKIHK